MAGRSLQELLAAAGEHNAAMGRGGKEGVAEDPMPAEQPTSEGMPKGTGDDVGYMTKEQTRTLSKQEQIDRMASEIQNVFGDDEPGTETESRRTRREKSPVERAVTATAGKFALKVTPVDHKLDTIVDSGSAVRTKVRVLSVSQDHANHILDHLANGSCADGGCANNIPSASAPTPTIGRRATAGLVDRGPAHDAWNAAHDALMRFGNHLKALPSLINSKKSEIQSRVPVAQAMLDDVRKRNQITSDDYAHVSRQIESAKVSYLPMVNELGRQGSSAPLSEIENGHNKVVSLQAELDVLKTPDGKFRTFSGGQTMDPTTLHSKIQRIAKSIYGLHQNAKRSALHAFGLATPLSDAEVKGVTSLAHSLPTNTKPISEGALPRDAHPLAEKDAYGNLLYPEKDLAPHGHIWSDLGTKGAKKVGEDIPLDVLPVDSTILEGYEKAGFHKSSEYRRMLDLHKFRESQQPGYEGSPYKLKNKFYNLDGTPFVQRKQVVPKTPGTAAADIQDRANMTQKERDIADAKLAENGIESGTHVMLSSPRFSGRDTYIPGGSGSIMKVSQENLLRLQRVLGDEHPDSILMDNALRKQQGRPSREEEAAAPPKENYEGPAHSFGTEETGQGLIDLPLGERERQTGQSKQFLIKEAHDHIVMGTGTGVAYGGQIPADLRKVIGTAGIASAISMARQTQRQDPKHLGTTQGLEKLNLPVSGVEYPKHIRGPEAEGWEPGPYDPPTTDLEEHIRLHGNMIRAPRELAAGGVTIKQQGPGSTEMREVRQSDLDQAKREYDDSFVRRGGKIPQ